MLRALLLAVLVAFSLPAAAKTHHAPPQGESQNPFAWLLGQPETAKAAPRYRSNWHREPRGLETPFPGFLASPSGNLLSIANRFIGHRNPTGTHRAWCADFVGYVLQKAGYRGSGSGVAISYRHYGHRVSVPSPGDIAVMRNHVTFFYSYGGRGFYGLGGNQHHIVKVSSFPLSKVVAWVRP